MKIESTDKTVAQLLRSSFYQIPRFQRPYSWEVREVEDFWQDTIVDSDADYFIGSIVLFKLPNDTFGIVDGQQRLTTVTMLLAGIRNTLLAQELNPLAKGLHGLIERKDINDEKQFILQTETSYLTSRPRSKGGPTRKTAHQRRKKRSGWQTLSI